MNDIQNMNNIPNNLNELYSRKAPYIKVQLTTNDNQIIHAYAANDYIVGNSVLDYYQFQIEMEDGQRFTIKSTGLVLSNTFGSTSYRLNLGGPLIPTSSNLLGLIATAGLPFRFKLFKPQKLSIDIDGKSSCMVGLDGYSGKYENIKKIEILDADLDFELYFLKSQPIETKRIVLAEQKIGRRSKGIR